MMQKIQRFGSAMFVPVLLFAFAGIIVGISTLFKNKTLMDRSPILTVFGISAGISLSRAAGLFLTKCRSYSPLASRLLWRRKLRHAPVWKRLPST